MEFKREEIFTLKGENGNEILPGCCVVYTTKNSDISIVAKYFGFLEGYFVFEPYGSEKSYRVKPSTIKSLWKVKEIMY